MTKIDLGFRHTLYVAPKDVTDLSGEWLDGDINGTNVFEGTPSDHMLIFGAALPPLF